MGNSVTNCNNSSTLHRDGRHKGVEEESDAMRGRAREPGRSCETKKKVQVGNINDEQAAQEETECHRWES